MIAVFNVTLLMNTDTQHSCHVPEAVRIFWTVGSQNAECQMQNCSCEIDKESIEMRESLCKGVRDRLISHGHGWKVSSSSSTGLHVSFNGFHLYMYFIIIKNGIIFYNKTIMILWR